MPLRQQNDEGKKIKKRKDEREKTKEKKLFPQPMKDVVIF